MKQLHSKSPCCQGKIYRFGQRRRQCSLCRRTWSIRQKKRGRKPKRINEDLVKRYLSNGSFNLAAHSKRLRIGLNALRYRNRQSRDFFLQHEPAAPLPQRGSMILIADALVIKVEKVYYAVHIMLIRSVSREVAVILPPVISPGSESRGAWRSVLHTIPGNTRERIVALIADGKPCFKGLSREFGWRLQRCHFHLLAELHRYASFKRRSKHQQIVWRIVQITTRIIHEKREDKLNELLAEMKCLKNDPRVPERMKRRFLSGFLRNYPFYRTYLNYPKLKLPTTTNPCESVISLIRKLLFQARGFRSCTSYEQWIKAVLLLRKTIVCKGSKKSMWENSNFQQK